ncbi:MAG: hypothetical protein ACHQ1H_01655 [Nitrososphaerales archaeon]
METDVADECIVEMVTLLVEDPKVVCEELVAEEERVVKVIVKVDVIVWIELVVAGIELSEEFDVVIVAFDNSAGSEVVANLDVVMLSPAEKEAVLFPEAPKGI